MSDNPQWEIIQGDALKVLSGFAPGTFDAVITDPPYASGGRTQAEKNKSTAKKYSSMGDHAPPPFDGDAKDQRSWTRWVAEWLYDARKACKPGAPVCMFIDWRQLPAATDALQWAGWIWRGTAVWDKGQQPAPEGTLPPAGGVHRLGIQRGHAHQPARALPAWRVQVRQSPEPHPPDGKAPAAHAGHREDHRAGRTDPGPLCWQRHHGAGRCAGGCYSATGIEVTDCLCRTGQRPDPPGAGRTSNDTPLFSSCGRQGRPMTRPSSRPHLLRWCGRLSCRNLNTVAFKRICWLRPPSSPPGPSSPGTARSPAASATCWCTTRRRQDGILVDSEGYAYTPLCGVCAGQARTGSGRCPAG